MKYTKQKIRIMLYSPLKCMRIWGRVLWFLFWMCLIRTHTIGCIVANTNQWICCGESLHFKFFMKLKDFECLRDLFSVKSKILTSSLDKCWIQNYTIRNYIISIFSMTKNWRTLNGQKIFQDWQNLR